MTSQLLQPQKPSRVVRVYIPRPGALVTLIVIALVMLAVGILLMALGAAEYGARGSFLTAIGSSLFGFGAAASLFALLGATLHGLFTGHARALLNEGRGQKR